MARTVRYFKNNCDVPGLYDEGPFVVCVISVSSFRVEVQHGMREHSVLPDTSIFRFVQQAANVDWPFLSVSARQDKVEALVDWLNGKVKEGVIVKSDHGYWYVPGLF